MNRTALLLAALAVTASRAAHAQIEIGASVGSFTLREETSQNRSIGAALGLSADWHLGRFGIRLDVARANLTPDDTSRVAFRVASFDGRVSYRIRPALQLEMGLSRRSISPEFASQDVGALSIGVRSDARLGPSAGVWARGALLPVVRFNGGGSDGTSVEVGLGTWLVLLHGRVRAELDYGLQRIDRTVNAAARPLQVGITRLGAMVRI